jgi:hypothetical protein
MDDKMTSGSLQLDGKLYQKAIFSGGDEIVGNYRVYDLYLPEIDRRGKFSNGRFL